MLIMLLRWSGSAPPPDLVRALSARGVNVERGDGGAVCARSPPSGARLWITPGALSTDDAVKATLAGAIDSISLRDNNAADRIARACVLLAQPQAAFPRDARFVAESPASRALMHELHRAAQTSMPVLLVGETGTGKEVAAHLVHAWSERKKRAFIAINCAAIPNELMEAELFGYTKGSFSGAVRDYDGRITAAEGGTVFLDEVDDTPFAFQVKLLRVLEDRVVSRLGEDAEHEVDFRLIAATNRDLHALIEKGEFGEDLYERLAIVEVQLPPLRERREDIPFLVDHFVKLFYEEEPAARQRHKVSTFSPSAIDVLTNYAWPGNVRELRNTIFAALVHKRGGEELLLSDLPRRLLAPAKKARSVDVATRIDAGDFDLVSAVDDLEREALAHALKKANGSATAAARMLGRVGRGSSSDPGGTVRAMAKRLGLESALKRR
jgi:DNA-binding NtrC family response regulator